MKVYLKTKMFGLLLIVIYFTNESWILLGIQQQKEHAKAQTDGSTQISFPAKHFSLNPTFRGGEFLSQPTKKTRPKLPGWEQRSLQKNPDNLFVESPPGSVHNDNSIIIKESNQPKKANQKNKGNIWILISRNPLDNLRCIKHYSEKKR